MGAGSSSINADKSAAKNSTNHHHIQEQEIIKQQLALVTDMKSSPQPTSKRKLRVSFTEADKILSQQRSAVSNEYSKPSTAGQRHQTQGDNSRPLSMPSYGTRIKYVDPPMTNGHANGYSNHKKPVKSNSNGLTNGYHKPSDKSHVTYSRPTHLASHVRGSKFDITVTGGPHMNGSANHHKDYTDSSSKRQSRPPLHNDVASTGQQEIVRYSASGEGQRSSSLTRRQRRARSASPRRKDRVVIQTPLTRSELENLKNVIRTAERSSSGKK